MSKERETANLVSSQTGIAVTISGDPVILGVGNTELVRVTGGGNVSIGETDNPQTKLHVDGTSNSNARITISRSGFLRNNYIGLDDDADELAIAADEDNEGSGSYVRIKVDGSEKARFIANGGLTFNGDTADANALDDYEEGTWTPTTVGASSATITVYGTSTYVKIGTFVTARFTFLVNSNADTNDLRITLPFTSDGVNNATGVAGAGMFSYTTYGSFSSILVINNSSQMASSSAAGNALTFANWSGKYFYGMVTYYTP